MERKRKKPKKLKDLTLCDKCGSKNVKHLGNEYMMGREIKMFVCAQCETRFSIAED